MFDRISTRIILLSLFVTLVKQHTFEEIQTWQDIIDDEAIEILPEDFEEVAGPSPQPAKSDKGNRASGVRYGSASCGTPPNFPTDLALTLENFVNWSEDLSVADVWLCTVRTPKEVVRLANWAYVYGYKIRARGAGQSWAPLTVTRNSRCSNTILVDTTTHLTQMRMVASKTNSELKAVYVQTGATMENLLEYLQSNKASLYSAPVQGESTVGGVLAVGGHGIGAARHGSRMPLGFSAGSLSNLILSFKAVVYDPESQSYILQKFTRNHQDSSAFLTHIGRAFLTEVLLLVGPAYHMRCENRFDYTADRLLAMPSNLDSDYENVASLIEKFRAVELTVYPYSDNIWATNCWTTSGFQVGGNSRYVSRPYPFTLMEGYPKGIASFVSRFLSGFYYFSPMISRMEYAMDKMKVSYGKNEDIWGPSNYMMLKYKSTVKKTTSSGYAILTSRDRVQKVASDFYTFYATLLERYSNEWRFPQNEPLQISITGLDNPTDIPGLGKFDPPALSFLSPMKGGEEYDTSIFIGINTIPGTRHYEAFMRELESYLFLKYDGNGAIVRPEWSKAWGFTDFAPWENHIVLQRVIPTSFGENWNWALGRFDHYDPYMVFSNDFLDMFLKTNRTSPKWNKIMKGKAPPKLNVNLLLIRNETKANADSDNVNNDTVTDRQE